MKTDADLERTLRATFAERADSVTDGPMWRGDGDVAHDAGDLVDLTDMTPRSRPSRTARWQAPALIAAAVALVAVIASGVLTGGFGTSKTVDAAGLSQPSTGSPTGAADDGASGATAGESSPWPTATVDSAGVITVSRGNPSLTLDVYEDALCPICAELENRYGAQISQAVDDGLVAVRYRIVDFLDPASASGDYSTRAYAALISVATHDGDRPGVFTQFRSALFQHQPVENGPSDLSDSDLAALAAGAGASAEAQRAIAGGAALDAATADARSNMASLTAVAASVGRAPGTPTVTVGGTPVATNEAGWLANLLTVRDGEAAETQTDAGR